MTSPLGLVVGPAFIAPNAVNAVADEVARSLAYARRSDEAPTIVTPLMYPGGSLVVLTLRQEGGTFFVTDGGRGALEADLLGGSRIYTRVARELAEANDIRFDSDLIFDIDVPRDALITAAIVVANTSKVAVETTAMRLANRRHLGHLDRLTEQFDRRFGSERVIRAPSIRGADGAWDLDLLVKLSDRDALIDLVAANANSANSSIAKFLDISRLPADRGFHRFSVLIDSKQTPNLGVLGTTSRLVEYDGALGAVAAAA